MLQFPGQEKSGDGFTELKKKMVWTRRSKSTIKTQVAAETQNIFLGSLKKLCFYSGGHLIMPLWPDLSSVSEGGLINFQKQIL